MPRPIPYLLCLLATLGSLSAHDFWIEPSRHHLNPGQGVTLRLRVGAGFQGDPVPRNPFLIKRFSVAGPIKEILAQGAEGVDPAGLARLEGPGLHWAVFESAYSMVELEAAKFESYLAEEGLDSALKLRKQRGASAKPAKDRFMRCAKCLLDVGGDATGFDRVLGLELELVPEKDPRRADADLVLKLLYRGRPLKGALVQAQRKGSPTPPLKARTDASGRVQLPTRGAGVWLAKAVHAVPSEEASADWQSAWASLTFETR